jgi:hypothetical protein
MSDEQQAVTVPVAVTNRRSGQTCQTKALAPHTRQLAIEKLKRQEK